MDAIDHTTDGLKRVIYQYKKSENFNAILSALLGRFDSLESVSQSLFSILNVSESELYSLDLLGAIVGQERNGQSDDEFKLMIKAAIVANSSSGQIDDIIAIFRLFDDSANVWVSEVFPAGVFIQTDAELTSAEIAFIQKLDNILSAGVQLSGISNFVKDTPFSFYSDDYNGVDVGGFGVGHLANQII